MITQRGMDIIEHFDNGIDGIQFEKLFKRYGGKRIREQPSLASHMWNKFENHNHSIDKVYIFSDREVRKILVKMVNAFATMHSR